MKSLTEVSFQGNNIRDAVTVGRAVQAVKGLKSLDVSRNEIESLPSDSFVDLIALDKLDLSHNKIVDLRRGALRRLPRLR